MSHRPAASLRSALRLAVLSLSLAATLLPSAAAAASPGDTLGVYRGAAAPQRVAEFETWLGRTTSPVLEYFARSSWSDIEGAPWLTGTWAGTGRSVVYSVPMIPDSGGTLAQGASGAYDSHFTALARSLVADGQSGAVVRLGWEFNGNWYKWNIGGASGPEDYAAYWRRVVTAMRAVSGANFKFEWNPALGGSWFSGALVDPARAYPGDGYVDFIGLDVYDQDWHTGWEDPVKRWSSLVNQRYGLAWHRDFAQAHGKPMTFPEWGLSERADGHGGGDNPYFVERMYDWIAANNVAHHMYFEFDVSDGELHELMSGRFPKAAERFRALFGGQAQEPAPTPEPTPAPAPALSVDLTSPAAGSTFTSVLDLAATATGGSGIKQVDFYVDSRKVASDYTAPYAVTYKAPKKLAIGQHQVLARAIDSKGQTAEDSASVTRVKAGTTTSLTTSGAVASRTGKAARAARAGGRLLTGRVRGADDGIVRLEIARRRGGRLTQVSRRLARLDSAGRYSRRVGRLRPGKYRIRARYLGSDDSKPSASRPRSIVVR